MQWVRGRDEVLEPPRPGSIFAKHLVDCGERKGRRTRVAGAFDLWCAGMRPERL